MHRTKLTVLLAALALGVAASAGAQTIVVAEPPVVSEGQVLIIAPAPQPMPDPAAVQKCPSVSPTSYWDCINSRNAGQ
ncbi:MAG TPA: hypothetical protein VF014_02275 [Casimicrobiaceae bacterium]|nr:hypothetical protein [Casimicrobiaceae bacterium]